MLSNQGSYYPAPARYTLNSFCCFLEYATTEIACCTICEAGPMVAAGWKAATVVIPLKKEARLLEISTGEPRYRHQFWFGGVPSTSNF